jgi:ribosomal protein L30E
MCGSGPIEKNTPTEDDEHVYYYQTISYGASLTHTGTGYGLGGMIDIIHHHEQRG